MIYVGIDPGQTGAVAIHMGAEWDVCDCPSFEMKVGKSTKTILDPGGMAHLLRYLADQKEDEVHVFLEKVHAMKGQGVSSMFSFGSNFGCWQGIIAAFQFKVTLVTPQAWKKRMMAGMGKDKDASRLRALQLFPHLREHLTRKKDNGRADALLIGEYGRTL